NFPAGRHRVLLRSRGGARLWLDGKVVARNAFQVPGTDGHGLVPPEPVPPAPLARLVGYGDGESVVEVETRGGTHAVVFEFLVGSKRFRAETGECCVAVQLAGESQFRVLGTSDGRAWLTDAGWEAASARQEAALTAHDDTTRRAAAASQDDYWAKRHAHARAWAERQTMEPPAADPRWPAHNLVDRFLAAKAQKALDASKADAGATAFHQTVLP